MSPDPLLQSAEELVTQYRLRRLSPVEVTSAVLERIAKLNPIYNAFCVVDAEAALESARRSEARWQRAEPLGPVDGVPATVKDLLLSRGWPTLRGSRTIDPDQAWDEDAPPVARLREQGAVFIGKTTTPEFGWKGVTDSPLTGITLNPWDRRMTPGGSSGGAAVAAALGMGTLNVATDGGGSIRIPAGFCGLFGIKPTWGLVPVYPHSPAWTLWHQGPIARTVADAALMLTLIARPDARDWAAGPALGIDYAEGLNKGIRGLRIGYSRTLGYATVDAEVARLVDRAVVELEALGAWVEELDLVLEDPINIMQPLWAVALALAIEPMSREQRALCDPPMLELAEMGFALSAIQYRQLERARDALGRRMGALHSRYDLLVTPQLATTAFAAGHEVPPGSELQRWWQWSPFTYPFNLTQQPAATVPCGIAANGLPVALQIVGAKYADALVLRAARAYESAHPFLLPP
jgi:aspartyl-tRNA(Asn)/glutamyl-tRNA(Gln) amidotransferase subunit A